MAGSTEPYDGSEMLNVINLFEVPAVSLGLTSFLASQMRLAVEPVAFRPPGGRVHKKLLVAGGRIVGAQLVGDLTNAGVILSYIRNGWDASAVSERVLRGPLPQGLVRGGPEPVD
jgi:NAD(P)H-nitrite reductase large subunit